MSIIQFARKEAYEIKKIWTNFDKIILKKNNLDQQYKSLDQSWMLYWLIQFDLELLRCPIFYFRQDLRPFY